MLKRRACRQTGVQHGTFNYKFETSCGFWTKFVSSSDFWLLSEVETKENCIEN